MYDYFQYYRYLIGAMLSSYSLITGIILTLALYQMVIKSSR